GAFGDNRCRCASGSSSQVLERDRRRQRRLRRRVLGERHDGGRGPGRQARCSLDSRRAFTTLAPGRRAGRSPRQRPPVARTPHASHGGRVRAISALTFSLAASLLFVSEPMFARMVLPLLGGSPSVWNTAMVFYQSALLAAYGYAHFLSRRG